MRQTVLATYNLSKRFKDRWAVKGLGLEVFEGDIFGFLGPNGAGKSTSIRMLLSLIRPTEGEVRIFGHDLVTQRREALRHVGGIVEKPDFYLYLSARRNLEVVGALEGGVTKTRIDEVLTLVGLRDRARDLVKTYSHGMKQRLGIAQALLTDPKLVILDEPTNGLDPFGMREVRDLIQMLAKERKKTVLLSSHLLNEVEQIATRMAVINKGELVVQGEVEALLAEGTFEVVIDAEPAAKAFALLRKAKKLVTAVTKEGEAFRVAVGKQHVPELVRKLVLGGVRVGSVRPRRSLEEYFLSITESGGAV